LFLSDMGQLVEAHGFNAKSAGACLAMFSVAQATARVATGTISEMALTWNARMLGLGYYHHVAPRSFFLVVAAVLGVAAHSVLAVATSRGIFVVGVVLSGTAFGMVWPLMVLIVGEVFGTANHGANYMFFDGFTSAIGTVLISKFITQTVYENHIDPDDQEMGNFACYGSGCFQASHIITVCLCLTCLVTGLGMVFKTRTKNS
jgi:MFS family permease